MDLEKESIEILNTFSTFGCTIADSGGKDSSVLKRIAMKSKDKYGLEFSICHNHTTVDAPETVRFVREEQQKYKQLGIDYNISYPEKSMWKLIEEQGFPPTRTMRYCCEKLKESYGKRERLVTGVRRAESTNRKKNQGVITIPKPSNELKEKAKNVESNFIQTGKGGWCFITTITMMMSV